MAIRRSGNPTLGRVKARFYGRRALVGAPLFFLQEGDLIVLTGRTGTIFARGNTDYSYDGIEVIVARDATRLWLSRAVSNMFVEIV